MVSRQILEPDLNMIEYAELSQYHTWRYMVATGPNSTNVHQL